MPATVAMRANPILRVFAERLRAKGKRPKVVITAVMRKLLLLAWTLLSFAWVSGVRGTSIGCHHYAPANPFRPLTTCNSPVLDSQDGIPTVIRVTRPGCVRAFRSLTRPLAALW
jgi:hypothetical protein